MKTEEVDADIEKIDEVAAFAAAKANIESAFAAEANMANIESAFAAEANIELAAFAAYIARLDVVLPFLKAIIEKEEERRRAEKQVEPPKDQRRE
jgi:hypothetical protein